MRAAAPSELTGLTALRGIAAWWVVVYHFAPFTYAHLPFGVWLVTKKGFLAVDLFFILSGFVIFYSYQRSLQPSVASIRRFLVKRIARVYPLHLLFLLAYLAYVLVGLLVRQAPLDTHSFGAAQFGLHLVILQAWGFEPGTALSWNYPAWSISAEFFAYLLFPLVLLGAKPQTRPSWLLLATIISCTAILISFYFFIGVCPGTDSPAKLDVVQTLGVCSLNKMIDQTSLLRCALQFCIGICLCVLYQRSSAHRRLAGTITTVLGVGVLLAGIVLALPDVYFATLGWTLLVFGVACEPWIVRQLLCHRPLLWLGNISYATYMCHALARDAFKIAFVRATGDPAVPFYAPVWSILLAFAGIALLSHFLYRLYERPAQSLVLRWLNADAQLAVRVPSA